MNTKNSLMMTLHVFLIVFLVHVNIIFAQESTETKFVTATTDGIKSEDVDFVLLRLNYLLLQIPSKFSELQQLLQEERNASRIYDAAWTEGTKLFEAKKANLTKLVGGVIPNVPDEYHIALITYTLHEVPADSPFFSDFNKRTRELCSGLQIKYNYPYKSFFKLLHLAIEALGQLPAFSPAQNVTTCYRGVALNFALADGQELCFQSYTSTSTDKQAAVTYSQHMTIFEFNRPFTHSIYLIHHSKHPDEEEVLVSPFVVYKVKGISIGSEANRFTKYNLVRRDDDSSSSSASSGSVFIQMPLKLVSCQFLFLGMMMNLVFSLF